MRRSRGKACRRGDNGSGEWKWCHSVPCCASRGLERRQKMLMRSTGLGQTELEATIHDCSPMGDHLVLYVDTVQPVKWKIRCTMTLKDLKKLIFVCTKMSVLLFTLNVARWFREPVHPGEF